MIFFFALCATQHLSAQVNSGNDTIQLKKIFDEALLRGESYGNLHYLCKEIGHRLTASPQAEKAVEWGYEVLLEMGFDTVYLQEIKAPFWERGDLEAVQILEENDNVIKLEAGILGGSVGTKGWLSADVVEVQGLDALKSYPAGALKGKIIFFNRPMDRSMINTFRAYGACIDQRYGGAAEAAKYGAAAVLVRSMTTETDEHPHTGSMAYTEGVAKIPAFSLSTRSADLLHQRLLQNDTLQLSLLSNCRTNPDITTHNVIGEIRGIEKADEIMIVGGHLDSWDLGEGAHDDGAGTVQSMEALRLFLATGYRPKHTMRVILFMNEENGNMGGKTYAAKAKLAGENHILALESDRGGFTPRGFTIDAKAEQVKFIADFKTLLEPYGLHYFESGFAGVDISPLKTKENKINPNLVLMGLYPDPQRYFDYHHTADDVFEQVNQRELELGAASMAAILYLMDSYWEDMATAE